MKISLRTATFVLAVFLLAAFSAILWWPASRVSPSPANKPLPASNSLAVFAAAPRKVPSSPDAEAPSSANESQSSSQNAFFTPAASAGTQTTNPPRWARNTREARIGPVQMLKQSLELTDEQARQLEPIFKAQQKNLAELRANATLSRQERAAKLKEIRQTTDEQIKRHLTPEQAEKWKNRGLNLQKPPQHQASALRTKE